jgi:hypothetical protein
MQKNKYRVGNDITDENIFWGINTQERKVRVVLFLLPGEGVLPIAE